MRANFVVQSKSQIEKRSVMIRGRKTSISIEKAFWVEIRRIAHTRRVGIGFLIGEIDAERQHPNLSSALRLYVLNDLVRTIDAKACAA